MILLFDSGAEVSSWTPLLLVNQRQECVGIGESTYMTVGRTMIKITLAGSLALGPGGDPGYGFMIPAGIRFDLADGTLYLPDEIRIQLSGRRKLHSRSDRPMMADQYFKVPVGESIKIVTRSNTPDRQTLWRDVERNG
ncbi:hypothetical protein PHMEG_00040575 [Phytophthora megakarya]|uniref:Peptidase A2 domain-containing protein n=1 Tax=Phytophthora megakarya TaxID=4795 RepID=A0A225UEI9_9STRA|nr:hypothetical protein PHMEG_00040575 [Phytophthora megakarya]